jgi:hypothetical protein
MDERPKYCKFHSAGLCKNLAMRPIIPLLCILIAFPSTLSADDGAAAIAAGGIVVMKRETRIVMAKEVLTISTSKVLVDYDFRNDSDQDVTTDVAFPIPAYTDDADGPFSKLAGFEDFKLWTDGVPTKYQIEARAYVGKHEITGLLHQLHVDIPSFGHEVCVQTCTPPKDIDRLARPQRQELSKAGAIESIDNLTPDWRVEKKYYWTQTFPAHSVVHIRHEYTPVLGSSNTIGDVSHFDPKREADAELASLCPTPALLSSLRAAEKKQAEPDSWFGLAYVDFILTTANTWKTPIEDFTLIVERPHEKLYNTQYVSFCWDGPVTKIDADRFSAHVDGLVPSKELRVGFIFGNTPRR